MFRRTSRFTTKELLQQVSVPSSSGHVFRQISQFQKWCYPVRFSPLFIGACVSTLAERQQLPGLIPFQSPLHRGMCFDSSPFTRIILYCPLFQSPLHRGMCFDPTRLSRRLHPCGFSPLFIGACVSTVGFIIFQINQSRFSPLFIGACVSTLAALPVLAQTNSFQSPLHRGMCFD